MTAEPLIQLQGVTFAYPGHEPVLRGVDFTLSRGQRLGLIGPNGTGKTTLAHLVLGLLRPRDGTIRLFGREAHAEKDFSACRGRIGLLFQNAEDQLFYPTVLEDVAFGPLNLGKSPSEAASTARSTLQRLGLAGFEDRLTHRLSGGEKKLVALATVLAMEPEVLFLDEPSNELDMDTRARLMEVMADLPQSTIVISHDFDFLARTTTDIYSISDGRIHFDGPTTLHEHVHAHTHGHLPHRHGEE